MKLLIEEVNFLNSNVNEEINESTGKTQKNYYLEGIFSTPDQKNRNGRIYPKDIWVREVNKFQKNISEKSLNLLGEWEHPPRATVDPMKAVIKIEALEIKDQYVWGKAKVLNNNSPETNQIKALIDEGFKIGVSSRGVGKLGNNSIVEDFNLVTFDLVSNPSNYGSNLNGLTEGHLFIEGVLEDVDYTICENGCIVEKEVAEKISAKKEDSVKEDNLFENVDQEELSKAILESFKNMFEKL